jgi:Zinc carboxypeptidase
MDRRTLRLAAGAVLLSVTLVVTVAAQKARTDQITSPKEQFGFDIGADYQLPNYTQLTDYWKKLDQQSDRMTLVEIGKTAEGRPQLMAIVTSPENHKKLARYKEIARKLALAEGLTDAEAKALAAEGKAVVWIDGGLHATEVLGAQQLMETLYQMVSLTDEETLRFLRDDIILFVHANPDGMELVSNWYTRKPDLTKRNSSDIPRLYQKYIGHDNNRDFYMSSQPESTNMNRILYHEWFPQIMYNHHQTGPTGTVLFAPPFRDPFNYLFDPLIPLGIDLVGANMHGRFAAEGKPGATMRKGSNYSTWWNGGLRTTVYFHNMIGLLTETIGNPTPIDLPFVPQRALPSADLPFPIAPQKWHFRQSIDYSVTANRSVFDIASRHREQFLYNIYQMGRNSIAKGNTDTWTAYPSRVQKMQEAVARDLGPREGPLSGAMVTGGFMTGVEKKYYDMLRDPALRDARGYILPADQRDFPTAVKFVNALIKTGITIHRATAPFETAGKKYPAGSIVVKGAQAFRAHVLDMFEPQDHPNDFAYPGGPPVPPYDSAGWTLAFQMGVKFDRVVDAFDGPFEKVTGFLTPPPVTLTDAAPAGYLITHAQNDAFIIVNRLLKNGDEVYWMKGASGEEGPGGMFVPARPQTAAVLKKAAADLGVKITPASSRPSGEMVKLRPVRVGLWDQYGGSMPSGWTRFILEQTETPFEVVYPGTLDAGNLNARFDVLVFVDGGIPAAGPPTGRRGGGFQRPPIDPATIPEEYRARLGSVTVERTIPQLRTFLENGGTILAIGSSTNLAYHLKLPISSALVERTATGERPLPQDRFYVPGSVLRVSVDNTQPLAWGLETQADVFFDHSPAFKLHPDAATKGVKAIAWFDSATPLRSGWAWGQHYLNGTVAIAEARVGKGKLFLYGPEILFRSQPHGTFKFFFNGLFYGPATAEGAGAGVPTAQ